LETTHFAVTIFQYLDGSHMETFSCKLVKAKDQSWYIDYIKSYTLRRLRRKITHVRGHCTDIFGKSGFNEIKLLYSTWSSYIIFLYKSYFEYTSKIIVFSRSKKRILEPQNLSIYLIIENLVVIPITLS
jgi:hypothetical protein